MKKFSMLAAAALILAGGMQSCAPDEANNTNNKAPETYTQKILLEYFSGAWCQYCPDGRVVADKLIAKYGASKFYPVTYHVGDYLENTDATATATALNVTGYPMGAINRVGGAVNRTMWDSKAQAVIDEGAKCGISIDATSKSASTYSVKVKLGVGKEALASGTYKIDGLLMKKVDMSPDGVATDASGKWFGQMNYYYNTAGHPYYKKGKAFQTQSGSTVYIITPYDHVNVHMKTFTTSVDAANLAAGSLSEYTFSVDIPYGDPSEWYFIASVNKSGLAPQTMNTQKVEFGATAAFD